MCSSPKIPKSTSNDRKPILQTRRDSNAIYSGAQKNPLRIDMNSASQSAQAGNSTNTGTTTTGTAGGTGVSGSNRRTIPSNLRPGGLVIR